MRKLLNQGFTLIELMVVVAIISVLAAIGLASYHTTQKRSRDARRKTDLEAIRSALELYQTENGSYPNLSWKGSGNSNWSDLEDELVPDYLSPLPLDPINNGTNPEPCSNPTNYRYNYQSLGSGANYFLTAIMEDRQSADASKCADLPDWPATCLGTQEFCYGLRPP